jgi:UDP-glucose 4-epimerase
LLDGGATIAVNVGTGQGMSVREVVDAARRVTGREIPARFVERRAGDPPELVAAPAAAQRVLGWRAARPGIETIIADAWRWHQVMLPLRAASRAHEAG